MKRRAGAALAAVLMSAGAAAQAAAPANCPAADEVTARHLLGLWRAQVEGAAAATLLLEPHPERADGLLGAINRNGERAQVSAEVEDGEFSLEESMNGINISAVWLGEVVEGSCGREIRGSWKAEGAARQFPFVLRKE